jgi:hypothetical protein
MSRNADSQSRPRFRSSAVPTGPRFITCLEESLLEEKEQAHTGRLLDFLLSYGQSRAEVRESVEKILRGRDSLQGGSKIHKIVAADGSRR